LGDKAALSIRYRIYLGFISIIVFIGVFAFAIFNALSEMNGNTEEIGGSLYRKVELTHQIQTTIGGMDEALLMLLLEEEPDNALWTITTGRDRLRVIHSELAGLISTERGLALYREAGRIYSEFEAATDRYIRYITSGEGERAEAYLRSDILPMRDELRLKLNEFAQLQESLMDGKVVSTAEQHRTVRDWVWYGLAGLLLLSVTTAVGVARSTLRSIRSISEVMNGVKDLESAKSMPRMEAHEGEELALIVRAYNRMAGFLETQAQREAESKRLLEQEHWIKSNVAAAINLCQGARTLDAFGERLLSHVVPAAGANAGALYYADPSLSADLFVRVAAYAGGGGCNAYAESFRRGEGLIGQCAALGLILEQKAPANHLRILSGLGESEAVHLLLFPISFEGSVVAVLELGSFTPFEPIVRAFLEELTTGATGVSLHNISNHMRIQTLLSESQTYVEELQTQSEELQQQQEELRSLNEKLAEQFRYAEQRTYELEIVRGELMAKADELQASSQFKSEFLANMSHELRTPLNSLLILAQMLADDTERQLSDKQREYAQTILYSGNELLTLINDVLDLSKIEAGQMEVAEEPFSLSDFVNDIERQFRGMAAKKGLAFNVRVAEELHGGVFITDPRKLQQIVNNLLSNAIKFTDEGSVKLVVYSETEGEGLPDGKSLLAFQVRDTGIGIPPEKHSLIFEAFRQADGRTNRKYGGTGLGLSISKELAAMLGGAIRLVSEEGAGSTFTATIPMKKLEFAAIREAAAGFAGAGRAADLEPERGQPSREPAVPERRGKILLVDDDIRNVYALSAALIEHQYEVVFAEEGGSALEKLEEHPDVDLVLMDMMMPGIDGYAATQAIRANPRFAELPVIALTAKAMKQDRELCLEAGANDYLSKPVKLDKLLSLLRVWMHSKGEEHGH